jgi:hypothetical protein
MLGDLRDRDSALGDLEALRAGAYRRAEQRA